MCSMLYIEANVSAVRCQRTYLKGTNGVASVYFLVPGVEDSFCGNTSVVELVRIDLLCKHATGHFSMCLQVLRLAMTAGAAVVRGNHDDYALLAYSKLQQPEATLKVLTFLQLSCRPALQCIA